VSPLPVTASGQYNVAILAMRNSARFVWSTGAVNPDRHTPFVIIRKVFAAGDRG